jgi:hypothetical protein
VGSTPTDYANQTDREHAALIAPIRAGRFEAIRGS